MFFRFIHDVPVSLVCPFLLWNIIPLYGYSIVYFSTYQLMDILNYFHVTLCVDTYFHFSWKQLGVELKNPMVILGEIEETAKLCYKVFVLFYISSSNVGGFPFLHMLANICSCPSFNIIAILVGVKWYFIVVDLHFLNGLHFLKALSIFSHTYLLW